ncbi:FAD-dependent oxidoreductase [Chloroflexota bacterium]
MYDVIIVGAGPAGLSAGVYTARKQLKTLLIAGDIGGQMNNTWGIENWLGFQFISAPDLIKQFEDHVSKFPIDQKIGSKVSEVKKAAGGFEVITDGGESYQAKTILVATGKKPRRLGVPGENDFTGRGVSYCAICDGPVFTGQRVAVVGGGNSAIEAVLDLLKIAEHVDLVSLTEITADAVLTDQLKGQKNLTRHIKYNTMSITGDGLVDSMVIKNMDTSTEKRLKVNGIFIEIGLVPNSLPVADIVPLNKTGEVPISSLNETVIPGIFAAGDVTNVPEKQIIIAAGEGAKAALQIHHYLQRKQNEIDA